jgi:hypothetical protein
MSKAIVADEGAKVVLVLDGRRIEMPPEVALSLSQHLYRKGKKAEEYRDANRIIMDQAIMQRAGLPFGLSSNPKIQEAARQEAQWNSDLRRHMPLRGIQPRAVVGTPQLRKTAHG